METPSKGQTFARRIILLIAIIVGGSLGMMYLPLVWRGVGMTNHWFASPVSSILIGAIIFLLIALLLANPIIRGIRKLEKAINQFSVGYLLFAVVGLLVGLLLAWFISLPFANLQIPGLSGLISIVLSVIFGYLGLYVGTSRREDLAKLLNIRKKTEKPEVLERKAGDPFRKYKILDTSVIIDGRIYDIAKAGFIEGVIVIPNFVLVELQYIADSADSVKRVRGRRGLDILNAL